MEDERAQFEEEKRRYEADRWNYWGNPDSPWAREEERRVRREKRRLEMEERRRAARAKPPGAMGCRQRGFYDRALREARAVEASEEAWDDAGWPEDEIDALRSRLVVAMRRQPGDVRGLMRAADALWRLEAAAKRPDRDKEHEKGRAMLRLLNSLNDPRILPAEEG